MSPLLDQSLLNADIQVLLDDVGTSITYTSWGETAASVDPSTGAVTGPDMVAVITAVKGVHTAEEVAGAAGVLEIGDVWFLCKASDLPDNLRATDNVTFDGSVYGVILLEPDEIGASTVVSCRKV